MNRPRLLKLGGISVVFVVGALLAARMNSDLVVMLCLVAAAIPLFLIAGELLNYFNPRLTLTDGAIFSLCWLGGYGFGILAVRFSGWPMSHLQDGRVLPSPWASLLCGAAGVVFGASAVYRRLRLRPLCLPICPHCAKRPRQYAVKEGLWPKFVLICEHCLKETELWLDPAAAEPLSSARPTLRIAWPYFFGRYERLRSQDLGDEGNHV